MNPGRFFGGAPGGPVPWGLPPFLPQMPQMPPERLERWRHIGPVLPLLKEGVIPKHIPVKLLEDLLSAIKEEGNACFKDKDYTSAYDMYTCALHICKHLQTVHYVPVNRELLSTIFSNRAACLLKMDFFKESIQDCEIAIQQNCDNIKAHFRMAMAYKSLRDYSSALDSAKKGQQQASNAKKTKEVKEFDDLICEVVSHMPSQVSLGQTVSVKASEATLPENSTKSSQQESVHRKNVSYDQPQLKTKTGDSKKTGAGAKVTASKSKSSYTEAEPPNAKKKAANIPKKKKVPTATLR